MNARLILTCAAVNGFIAVGAGAIGAHALQKLNLTAQQTGWFNTAVTYQGLHALVLLGCALLIQTELAAQTWILRAAFLFLTGIILFSGTLYLMALTAFTPHAIVPFGGIAFLAGWICLAIAGLQG